MRALSLLLLASAFVGCNGYTSDDRTAAEIGTRNAAALLNECTSDDAGACRASLVRARALVIFCAAQHAEVQHGLPFDGGPQCP